MTTLEEAIAEFQAALVRGLDPRDCSPHTLEAQKSFGARAVRYGWLAREKATIQAAATMREGTPKEIGS